METTSVADFVQVELKRWADQINREAWKFEHIEQPTRGRLKLATMRPRFGR